MGRLKIVGADEQPFIRARDRADRDRSRPGGATAAEIDATSVRFHHAGSDGEPQLFEIRIDPDSEVQVHAHTEDEIIAVVEGELRLGSQVCGAGSSIFVPGNTLYGFTVGPQGVRFLNFRPRHDQTYWTKEAFVDARQAARVADGSGPA